MNYKNGLIDAIGNTPLIRLKRIEEVYSLKSKIFAKLERDNPTGSIKDRIAKEMILSALERKDINQDTILIEPTSGNTGIGICAIAASLGMKAKIFMPSSMSIERIKMMRAFGAEVVLTDAKKGMSGAIEECVKFNKENPNSFMLSQFDNTDNSLAHYKTTGPEIYSQLDGNIDVFVAGFGTGGTITGISKYLKEKNLSVHTVGIEPKESPVVTEEKKGPHGIQGIGAGFIPSVLKLDYVDEVVSVETKVAYEYTRILARTEGLFCGISSGCNLYQAIEEAKKREGSNIVTVLPDNGERYLSVDGLFE